MDDTRIIELYWQRDETALHETQVKYERYCRAIALRILQDEQDAAECTNDTWLQAWHSIPPHRPICLSAFLGSLTRRLAVDRWRRKHADKRGGGEFAVSLDELESCLSSPHDPQDTVDAVALAKAISTFLRTLPETEGNVFIRRYWYVDSVADIGKRYGFGQSKVKMMLLRTRNKLCDYLKKEGFEL